MSRFRELTAAILGQLGEKIVASSYRQDGWGVIASFKFSGELDDEAPAIELEGGGREITPDLDISKGGRRAWIEVKTYTSAAYNHRLESKVHGIPTRKLESYRAVEERSGNPVYLAIVEMESRSLLVSPTPITEMLGHKCPCRGCRAHTGCEVYLKSCPDCYSARRSCPAHRSMNPQTYWERHRFHVKGLVSDSQFTLLTDAEAKHEQALRSGHAYRKHAGGESFPASTLETCDWVCLGCSTQGVGSAASHRCTARQDYWVVAAKYLLAWYRWSGASNDEVAVASSSSVSTRRSSICCRSRCCTAAICCFF